MAATRTKKKVFTGVTMDEALSAARLFSQNSNSIDKLNAKMNEEITKIRAKYDDQLTALADGQQEPLSVMEAYAKENKDTWTKKSYDLVHAMIGFRTGNPQVSKDKKFTWDAVTELLKKSGLNMFLRLKTEVNKEAILQEKDPVLIGRLKEDAYISIIQEETFYVEPKKEEAAI